MKASEIIRDYCKKFPTHGNKTIADAVYKRHPHLWRDAETCRSLVRVIRGASGDRKRATTGDKSAFKSLGKAGQPQLSLPRSIATPWQPYELPNPSRIAVLSDIHLPYHDDEALKLAIESVKDYGPDIILLNGDIADFFACSRWDRDPREVNLKTEIDIIREFLAYTRQSFPKAEIIWKDGNHEERYEYYLWRKAPELLNVDKFSMESIFGLDDLGITRVTDKRIIMAGKLPVLHGHEYPKGMTNPVNQARGMFLRGLDCALAGHGHRSSEHSETSLMGRLVTCWSTGCLCNLNPDYAVINKWSHGFAFVETDKTGAFEVDNKRIYHGRVW